MSIFKNVITNSENGGVAEIYRNEIPDIKIKVLSINDLNKISQFEFNYANELRLVNLNLNEIPNLLKFKNLKKINLSCNKIILFKIDNLPKTIEEIYIDDNLITEIPDMREFLKLRKLSIIANKITKVGILNDKLQILNCHNNYIRNIEEHVLPNTLLDLNIGLNSFQFLPILSENLKNVNFELNNTIVNYENNTISKINKINRFIKKSAQNKILKFSYKSIIHKQLERKIKQMKIIKKELLFKSAKILLHPNKIQSYLDNGYDIEELYQNLI
jgi:hypothetical protein